ncbi:MAG: hypothetical protein R2875_02260 [Desulfobacterales bacterium]
MEINPLVITRDKKVLALDAKMDFGDNAMFRHKDLQAFRDLDEEDPLDVAASKYNLNYINLDSAVGNMVNGAGLATGGYGHHQAGRRGACQFSGCWGWGHCRDGGKRV